VADAEARAFAKLAGKAAKPMTPVTPVVEESTPADLTADVADMEPTTEVE
jgi:hypothetical protein